MSKLCSTNSRLRSGIVKGDLDLRGACNQRNGLGPYRQICVAATHETIIRLSVQRVRGLSTSRDVMRPSRCHGPLRSLPAGGLECILRGLVPLLWS